MGPGPSPQRRRSSFSLPPRQERQEKTKLVFADICDDVFNKKSICLITSTNSVSTKNFGRSKNLAEKYVYGDVAGAREVDPELNSYACARDQDAEGAVVIKNPPIYSDGPSIVTLVTQYGIGKPIHENSVAKRILQNVKNASVRAKLNSDSEKNRMLHFRKCLTNLKNAVEKGEIKPYISKFIIPVGIGRSGIVDPCWLSQYLPAINKFSFEMSLLKKEVLLLSSEVYFASLEEKFKNKKDYTAYLYRKLCKYEVIQFEAFENLEEDQEDLNSTIDYDDAGGEEEEDDEMSQNNELSRYFMSFCSADV